MASAGLLFTACQSVTPTEVPTQPQEEVLEYKEFRVDLDIPTDSKESYGSDLVSRAVVDPQGDGEILWEGVDYVTAVSDNSVNKYPLYIETPSLYNNDKSQLIGLVQGRVTSETTPNGLVSFYLYYPADTEATNDPVEVRRNDEGKAVISINYPEQTTFDIRTDIDTEMSYYESTVAYGQIQPLISGGVRDLLVSADGLRSLESDVNIGFYPFNVLTTLQLGMTGLSQEDVAKIYELEATAIVGSITAVDAQGNRLAKGPFDEQLNLDPTRITTDHGIELSDINNFLEPERINGRSYVANRLNYVDSEGNPRPTKITERIIQQPGEAPTLYMPIFSSPVLEGVMAATSDWLFKAEIYNGDELILVVSKIVDGSSRMVWPVGTFNTVQMIGDGKSTFDFGPFN